MDTRWRILLGSVAMLSCASSLFAQRPAARILLPPPPVPAAIVVDQVAIEGSPVGEENAASVWPSSEGPPRLEQIAPSSAAASVTQLAPHAPTAAASPALSTPAQGAPGLITPVLGEDRCDPGAEEPAVATDCENVIERRAAEFARPQSEQSAEQRLLTVNPGDSLGLASAIERTVGQSRNIGDYPDERSSQELASIVLAPPEAAQPSTGPDQQGADATIAEILNTLRASPPN